MIPNDSAKYVWDAHRAAERVVEFTAGLRHADYLASNLVRAAVERQFTIIGEALAALRRKDPDTAARIPDLPRIVGFRNALIHGYDRVNHDAV